jgi:hypothetical protein
VALAVVVREAALVVVVREAAAAVVEGEGWEVEAAGVELAGWAAGLVAGEGLGPMVAAGAALKAAAPAPCSQRLSQSKQPWLPW